MNVNPTNTYWFNKSMYDYHDNRIESLQKKIKKHQVKRAKHSSALEHNAEWNERWEAWKQQALAKEARSRRERQTQIETEQAERVLREQVAKAEEVKVTVKKTPTRTKSATRSRKTAARRDTVAPTS